MRDQEGKVRVHRCTKQNLQASNIKEGYSIVKQFGVYLQNKIYSSANADSNSGVRYPM